MYTCIHILAVPVIPGQKQALVEGNKITFLWEPIIGYATHVVIEKCDLQCEIVFNTTNTTVSSVQFYGEDLYSYTYQLKVYQHHEMVYEREFFTQIPSDPSKYIIPLTVLGQHLYSYSFKIKVYQLYHEMVYVN